MTKGTLSPNSKQCKQKQSEHNTEYSIPGETLAPSTVGIPTKPNTESSQGNIMDLILNSQQWFKVDDYLYSKS